MVREQTVNMHGRAEKKKNGREKKETNETNPPQPPFAKGGEGGIFQNEKGEENCQFLDVIEPESCRYSALRYD